MRCRAGFPGTTATICRWVAVTPAGAWHRGHTEIFAVLPELPGNMSVPSEGLTVGPDGTVYTPSFGINSEGAVPGPPHLFSFKPNGQLLYNVALVNPAPSPAPQPSTTLLGLVFQKSSQTLLICDLSNGIVWQADPRTGNATVFMTTGQGATSGLNALTRFTVDAAGQALPDRQDSRGDSAAVRRRRRCGPVEVRTVVPVCRLDYNR